MAYDDRSLDNYVDVAQRIADFRELHPEGSLEPLNPAASYSIERVPNPWCTRCKGKRGIKEGRAAATGNEGHSDEDDGSR